MYTYIYILFKNSLPPWGSPRFFQKKHCLDRTGDLAWRVDCAEVGKVGSVFSLRIQIHPKKRIFPIFLFWGWDWNPQSYSREVFGFLGIDPITEVQDPPVPSEKSHWFSGSQGCHVFSADAQGVCWKSPIRKTLFVSLSHFGPWNKRLNGLFSLLNMIFKV